MVGRDWEASVVLFPLLLEGSENVLHCEDEEGAAFWSPLFAASLELDVFVGSAAPYLRRDRVSNEFAGEVETKEGVHWGVE